METHRTRMFFPALFKHLEKQSIHVSMFATQWLLTLYTSSFLFDLVGRVWDYFISEVWKIVFRVMLELGLELHSLKHSRSHNSSSSHSHHIISQLSSPLKTRNSSSSRSILRHCSCPWAFPKTLNQSNREGQKMMDSVLMILYVKL